MAAVEHAVDLPEAAAAAHLAKELGDDADLLAEAREVLEAGRRTDGFLSPKRGARAPGSDPVEAGMRLGPFRIRAMLARGGMGTVFVAEQEEPRRTVALKVLSSALFAPRAKERFRYEVQALASLQHRGIAPIYEAGVHTIEDGPVRREIPWFAMEYIEEAATILAYADERGMDTPARLRLFIEVCEAVQYGHQKGVVHRDLKPDNLLVNKAGHPKVIDFGVARATEIEQQLTTLKTGVGEIVGTLPYMAPEQVAGKEGGGDVRSDVYALGVVLYQLLAGVLPIPVDRTDFVTSARRICEDAPRRPSSVDKRLAGDLEAILLKALEKEPTRRYPSAEALGSDLRRYLERRPVEARSVGTLYQFRLLARRHLVLVIAATAIVLVLIAAAIVSTHFAVRSHDAEKTALAERDEALKQRARAEKMFETMLDQSFASTLEIAPRIHQLAGGAKTVQTLMTAVREQLRTLEEIGGDAPRVRLLLAETLLRVGDMEGNRGFPNLGNVEAAAASYRQALAIAVALQARQPENWRPRHVEVRALRKLGEIKTFDGTQDDAKRALFEEALAKALPLAAEVPRDPVVVSEIPLVLSRLGQMALNAKDMPETLRYGGEIIAACEAMIAWAPDPAPVRRHSAIGYDLRGYALRSLGRLDEALAAYDRAIALAEPTATKDGATYEERRHYVNFVMTRAGTAVKARRFREGEDGLKRARDLLIALRKEDPEDRRTYMQLQVVSPGRLLQPGAGRGDAGRSPRPRRRDPGAALHAGHRVLPGGPDDPG